VHDAEEEKLLLRGPRHDTLGGEGAVLGVAAAEIGVAGGVAAAGLLVGGPGAGVVAGLAGGDGGLVALMVTSVAVGANVLAVGGAGMRAGMVAMDASVAATAAVVVCPSLAPADVAPPPVRGQGPLLRPAAPTTPAPATSTIVVVLSAPCRRLSRLGPRRRL